MVVYPYWSGTTWVFDDSERQLKREAFIAGADDILTEALVLRGIGLKETKDGAGFKCTFSTEPIEGGFTATRLRQRTLGVEVAFGMDWDWGDLLTPETDPVEDIPEAGAQEMKLLRERAESFAFTEEEEVDYGIAWEELDPSWLPYQQRSQPRSTVMGMVGNDYRVEETGSEGWLCPALLKFYEEAPETLYFAVERLDEEEEETDGA